MSDLIKKLGLSAAAESSISKIPISKLKTLADNAYSGENFEFPIKDYPPEERLAAVLHLLPEKFREYQNFGCPEDIILHTFRDVTLRSALHEKQYGAPGLTADDAVWFRHIMNAAIFQIGPIQYQIFDMIYLDKETVGEEYMTFPNSIKKVLPAGSPVINCHIPRGADLRGDAVSKSLSAAREFFQTYFPEKDFKAFICYSWLLYPPMVCHLSPDSTIRRFAGHFTILSSCTDSDQAMENLFPDGSHSENMTSLQRLAAECPETFGYSLGIIPI